jgi:hypothetical protein
MANSLSKILNNKYFFYFILFLAVTNVLGYIASGNLNAIVFFILITFLVTKFNDNIVIALLIAIVLTNLFLSGQTTKKIKEGMTNKPDKNKKNIEDNDNKKIIDGPEVDNSSKNVVSTTDDSSSEPSTVISSSSSTNAPESMNNLSSKKRNRIDYASTVEQAYDNLHQILGEQGIKGLTDDTQKLVGQQQQLAEAMKTMTPLLETAKNMLDGFDMKNLNGLADFAKNFTNTK